MTLSIQEISDRIEIDDLLTRYATGVDRRDWGLLETCFTPDAYIDYTAFGGTEGHVKEVRAWLEKTFEMFGRSQHLVTNREVVIDGDTASARSGFYNPMHLPREGKADFLFIDGGYYVDELVRTDDGWKIALRREEFSYSTRTMQLLEPRPAPAE